MQQIVILLSSLAKKPLNCVTVQQAFIKFLYITYQLYLVDIHNFETLETYPWYTTDSPIRHSYNRFQGTVVRSQFSLNGGSQNRTSLQIHCMNHQTKMFQRECNNYVWNQLFTALNLNSLVREMSKIFVLQLRLISTVQAKHMLPTTGSRRIHTVFSLS